jgi:hypothetical protein
MCEGSIHVPHRLATSTERLVVRKIPSYGAMKGYYPYESAGDGKLVCCRGTVGAILKTVRFEAGLAEMVAEKYEGKRNVKVTLSHRPYHDVVEFPNGHRVMLSSLKEGTRIDIGVPLAPRKTRGMKAVEAALHEVAVLPPEPKPEDERAPEEPAAPAEEPTPVREPEPTAPAARR